MAQPLVVKKDDDCDEEEYYSPFLGIEKGAVLQEARVFHDPQLDERRCCQVITKLLYLLNQGDTFTKVGSFVAGYGSSIMSRLEGPKKAREMWFLSRFYTADEAERMGLVNAVVPLADLEKETVRWCRQILRNSSMAIRVLKSTLNAADNGHAGLQELGGNATLIFYGTEEAKEGKNAYMEWRRPNLSKFPRKP